MYKALAKGPLIIVMPVREEGQLFYTATKTKVGFVHHYHRMYGLIR